MKKVVPALVVTGGALVIALAIGIGTSVVRADDDDTPGVNPRPTGEAGRAPTPPGITPTPTDPTATATAEERAVLADLDRRKWIAAREGAQKILAAHPDSFVATWAMANVHHYEEANHARALFHARRAEALLAARGLDPTWHRNVLIEESYILSEMDQTTEQLAVLRRLGTLYPPGHKELEIWPLIKLRRYAEAEALAEAMLGSDDANERLQANNGLMAMEGELHSRDAAYQRAQAAIAAFPQSCIILRNAGEIAWERFRPQEAEELLIRGATAEEVDCASSPYVDLAWLYLLQGELQQAVAALKSGNAVPIDKQYRPHHVMERRAILSDLLYALGKPEEAEQLASEVYDQPERTGMVSSSVNMLRLTRTLRYWLALDARLIFERERASYRHFYSGVATKTRLALAKWEVRRAMFQLSAEADALITVTRPNIGDVRVARWTIGGLIEILGPGVMAAAVDEARRRDAAFPEATAYLDAVAGEIAYRRGDLGEAIALGDRAIAGVPAQDGLIRLFVQAWLADARWRSGDRAGAVTAYHAVLLKLPSAFRILDVAIPVTITDDGSALAREVSARLADSTRFAVGEAAGFRIEVSATDRAITTCLADRRGFQFSCATTDKGTDAALDAFHLAAFSPKVAMTQADMSGLDGSTSSRTADQVLEGLLGK